MLGLNYIIESLSTIFQSRCVLFIMGAILLVGSYFIPNKKSNIPKPKTQSIFAIIAIGIATFLIEAGTALPYFAATGILSNIDIPFTQ